MHSITFPNRPILRSFAAIGGQKEGEGYFGKYFDRIETDPFFGKQNWEQAETALQSETFRLAVNKALLKPAEIDCILAEISSTSVRSRHLPTGGRAFPFWDFTVRAPRLQRRCSSPGCSRTGATVSAFAP